MTITEAFRQYSAKLVNNQWAVSAISDNNELVVSCWHHYLSNPDNKTIRYEDTLSRRAVNKAGNNLLREHIALAKDKLLNIRLVIVRTDDTDVVDCGEEASSVKKRFFTKIEIIGKFTSFDGDRYVIDFKKAN